MIKHIYFKQFNLACHLLKHSLNVKQFKLTHRQDPFRCYHSGTDRAWKWWQWRCTPYSPKLQHYWNFSIRLFSVISETLVRWDLTLCRDAVRVFYSPSRLGCRIVEKLSHQASLIVSTLFFKTDICICSIADIYNDINFFKHPVFIISVF